MRMIRRFAVLAVAVVLVQPLVACNPQAAVKEPERLATLWNGYHAEVRLVVYDDLNANSKRRKVAYNTDVSVASDQVKALIQSLASNHAQPHCNESTPVYVLEITEVGQKRRYSSDNNHCKQGMTYAGYVPTQALAQLAEALSTSRAF